MHELMRTNDVVLVSFVEALLRDGGFSFHVADVHISMAEGSIGAFPRRILVATDEIEDARRLLQDAGLSLELSSSEAAPTLAPGAWKAEPQT